jgi:DNA helicase HerA-like ATPase
VLGLNATQESSLALVFSLRRPDGLPLLDLKDLNELLKFLVSDEGKPELANIGGLAKATVGVILRQLSAWPTRAGTFFGEPEFDTADLLKVTSDGRASSRCWNCRTSPTGPRCSRPS